MKRQFYLCVGWGCQPHDVTRPTVEVESLGRKLNLCEDCKAEFDLEYPTLVAPANTLEKTQADLRLIAQGESLTLNANQAMLILTELGRLETISEIIQLNPLPPDFDVVTEMQNMLKQIGVALGVDFIERYPVERTERH